MNIELIYFEGCPNVDVARKSLREACSALGLKADWKVLTCPACWPLYAGLLSALGVSFVDYTPFLLPVTAVLLLISLIPLAWKGRQRWGYRPIATGFMGAVLILSGKFWLLSQSLYYVGIAILLVASIWNIWPRRKKEKCYRCISETS